MESDLSNFPKLYQLKGVNTFTTPNSYFDQLESDVLNKLANNRTTIKTNLWRKYAFYVAAASIVAVVSVLGFYLFDSKQHQNELISSNTEQNHSKPKLIDNSTANYQEKLKTESSPNADQIKNEDSILNFKSHSLVLSNRNAIEMSKIQIINEKYTTVDLKEVLTPPFNKTSRNSNEQNAIVANNVNVLSSNTNFIDQHIGAYPSLAKPNESSKNRFLPTDTCVNDYFSYQLKLSESELKTYKYVWNNLQGGNSFSIHRSGKYILQYFLEDRLIGTDTMLVSIVSKPKPVLKDHYEICSHESLLLSSKTNNPNYQYRWSLSTSTKSEILLSDLEVGNYKLILDVFSCVDTVSVQTFISVNDCKLKIPNVITPNGDGFNDAFTIQGIENYPLSSLTILDRNGKILYNTLDYQNDWKADNLPAGTYFYSLKLNDSKQTEKGGILTIIR
jgi:gliding motility-associated-like protein